MKLVKCSKGHFYDSERFSSCPHCAPTDTAGDSVTISMPSSAAPDVTMAVSLGDAAAGNDALATESRSYTAMDDPVTQKSQEYGMDGTITDTIRSIENGMNKLPDDDGVTISHYSSMMEQMDTPSITEPVVGWLVCLSGTYFGQGFPLKSGRNFVGRGRDMDVCLEGEPSVSRKRHAVVIYEHRGRVFLAQPGDSRELFYLNDKVVLENETLQPYDILSIGKVKMMLIPFCTEKFAWEDLKQKDEKNDGTK